MIEHMFYVIQPESALNWLRNPAPWLRNTEPARSVSAAMGQSRSPVLGVVRLLLLLLGAFLLIMVLLPAALAAQAAGTA